MRIASITMIATCLLFGVSLRAEATRQLVPRFQVFDIQLGLLPDGTIVRVWGNRTSGPYQITVHFQGNDYTVPPDVIEKIPPYIAGFEFTYMTAPRNVVEAIFLRFTASRSSRAFFSLLSGDVDSATIRISAKDGIELINSNVQ